MDLNKLQGYLNIAKKAGYVIIGGEKLEKYTKKIYLIIYDSLSKNNTLKIVEKYKDRNINVLEIKNLEELIKITNCKIIGIKNKNLSDIIYNLINN